MKSTLFAPFFLLLLSFASAQAQDIINVQTLNRNLQQQNAAWVAKDTWLTRLSKPEIKRMMGLRKTPAADVQFIAPASAQLKQSFPAALDWRNKDGKNWVSPILNQGNCGSCVAFAAIGVLETQVNISSVFPNLNMRFSPQQLFSCGGGACEYGWYPSSAAQHLMRQGVTDEACMPYTSGATGQDVACEASCANTSQRTYKIADYQTPTATIQNISEVKQALQKGPVMTTLSVYSDFVAYSSGVYRHTSGDYLGGHAVSIVGYDDATQSYIIRNSWGKEWGEQGFGHVAYDDISGVGDSTISFDIPAMGGAVSLLAPRDYSYVTGTTDFSASSSFKSTDAINMVVFDKSNKAVWSESCQSADCRIHFDSSKLADGRYEVQAIATNAHGEKLGSSMNQFFYIVNQAPEINLSFKGDNVDLKRPLSERIEFAITAKSSSVPMSGIEFHFKDSSGKETVRTAEVVLEQMKMGWRTNVLPNGVYEIWMVGRLKSNSLDLKTETPHLQVTLDN